MYPLRSNTTEEPPKRIAALSALQAKSPKQLQKTPARENLTKSLLIAAPAAKTTNLVQRLRSRLRNPRTCAFFDKPANPPCSWKTRIQRIKHTTTQNQTKYSNKNYILKPQFTQQKQLDAKQTGSQAPIVQTRLSTPRQTCKPQSSSTNPSKTKLKRTRIPLPQTRYNPRRKLSRCPLPLVLNTFSIDSY